MSRDLCAMMEKGRFACVGDIKAIIFKEKKKYMSNIYGDDHKPKSNTDHHINLIVMHIQGQVMFDLP